MKNNPFATPQADSLDERLERSSTNNRGRNLKVVTGALTLGVEAFLYTALYDVENREMAATIIGVSGILAMGLLHYTTKHLTRGYQS